MNELHEHLDDIARGHDIPAGDAHAVIERAGRRLQRRRRTTGMVAALAIAAVSLAVIQSRNDTPDTTLAAGGSDLPSSGDSGISWQRVSPSSALALYGRPATLGGQTLYALSTAPGQAPTDEIQPLRVWTSSDGVDWHDRAAAAEDLYLSDLDARDGRVYAIGTGQATAATIGTTRVPELRVGRSDDGAATWQTAALDVDLAGIAAHATSMTWSQRMIAASNDAVVAVVAVRAELDVPEVLPDGATAPDGWAITPTGVDVLGPRTGDPCPEGDRSKGGAGDEEQSPRRVWPEPCADGDRYYSVPPQQFHDVVHSYAWADLGIEGDELNAVLGRPMAFVADAAQTSFQRVALPGVDGEIGWMALDAGDDGFDLVVAAMGRDASLPSTTLHSVDGRTWAPAPPLPGDMQWISAMGRIGDHLVVQGTDDQNLPVVVVGADAGGSQVVRPADLIDPAYVDGREMWWAAGGIGDLGIAVVVGLSSKTESEPGQTDYVLLTSRDGTTWEQQSLDELAGARVTSVGGVIVTGDRMIVNVVPEGDRDADGHLNQLTLVGTAS